VSEEARDDIGYLCMHIIPADGVALFIGSLGLGFLPGQLDKPPQIRFETTTAAPRIAPPPYYCSTLWLRYVTDPFILLGIERSMLICEESQSKCLSGTDTYLPQLTVLCHGSPWGWERPLGWLP
jgi:hypothetical protein